MRNVVCEAPKPSQISVVQKDTELYYRSVVRVLREDKKIAQGLTRADTVNGFEKMMGVTRTETIAESKVTEKLDLVAKLKTAGEKTVQQGANGESIILDSMNRGQNKQGFVSDQKLLDASEAGKLRKNGETVELPKGVETPEDVSKWRAEQKAKNVATKVFDPLEKPDPRVLDRNMRAAGNERPLKHAAHHIVAGIRKEAAKTREILKKFEISINAAENGVYLPEEEGISEAIYHRSLHTGEYFKEVEKRLLKWNSREKVLEELKAIGEELKNGTFWEV